VFHVQLSLLTEVEPKVTRVLDPSNPGPEESEALYRTITFPSQEPLALTSADMVVYSDASFYAPAEPWDILEPEEPTSVGDQNLE